MNDIGSSAETNKRYTRILLLSIGAIDAVLVLCDAYAVWAAKTYGPGAAGALLNLHQVAYTLLGALNFPAFLIGMPIAAALRLDLPMTYMVLFPLFLVWWWCVGYCLDRRILDRLGSRGNPAVLALSLGIALFAAGFGVLLIREAFTWWYTYSREIFAMRNFNALQTLAPGIWCFGVAIASAVLAKRIAQRFRTTGE